jgi:hypothetical protein
MDESMVELKVAVTDMKKAQNLAAPKVDLSEIEKVVQ